MLLWFLFVKVPAPDIFLVQVKSLYSCHFEIYSKFCFLAKYAQVTPSYISTESSFRPNSNCC